MKRIDTRVIAIENIHPCPYNVRKDYGDMTELVASVKAHNAVLFDISVIEESKDNYVVYAGNRRLEAAKRAGLKELSCAVCKLDKGETVEAMLIENMQREGLSVKEICDGFQMMLDLGATVADISKSSGFSMNKVKTYSKLSKLDKDKFEEADKREPNITDYMKLDKIKSIDDKNKLLDSIGTSNFDYELKKTIEKQDVEDFTNKHVKLLKDAGVRELGFVKYVDGGYRLQLGDDKWSEETYRYVYSYNAWQYINNKSKYEFELPEFKDSISDLFYVIGSGTYGCLSIYKLDDKNQEDSPEVALMKRRDEANKNAINEANELAKTFNDLHFDFIKNFSAYNKYKDFITYYFAKMSILCHSYDQINKNVFDSLTENTMNEDESFNDYLLRLLAGENSLEIQYKILFASLYSPSRSYVYTRWDYDSKLNLIRHECVSYFSIFYELILNLGYSMSDEEALYYTGEHQIFKNEWAKEFMPISEETNND